MGILAEFACSSRAAGSGATTVLVPAEAEAAEDDAALAAAPHAPQNLAPAGSSAWHAVHRSGMV